MEFLIDAEDQFPEITEFDEIIERPLFTDTRRPVIHEEITANVTDPQERKSTRIIASGQYLLSAVVITKDKRIAHIQSDRIQEPQKIALGEILDGWILSDIQPRQITLERDGEVKILKLEIIPSPKLAAQKENPEYKARDVREIKDVRATIVEIDEHGDEIEYEEEYEDDPD